MALFKMADSFPNETGETSKDVKSLRSYVYQLQETLRYVLGNLGSENFNETDLGNITEPIYARIEDAEEMSTELSVTAQGIQAQVASQGKSITSLQVTASGLSATVGTLSGDVATLELTVSGITFSDEDGTTTITGKTVATGTFKAYGWNPNLDEGEGNFRYAFEIYENNPDQDDNGLYMVGAIGYRDDAIYILSRTYEDANGDKQYPKVWISGDGGVVIESFDEISISTGAWINIFAEGDVNINANGAVEIIDNTGVTWSFADGGLYRNGKEVL